MNIIQSASKIILVMLTVGLIALTFMKIVDPKDFMTATMLVFTYYFSKSAPSGPPNTQ